MRHYEKVYDEAGRYLGLLRLGFNGRWIAEDAAALARSFEDREAARDWIVRQDLRNRRNAA